MYRQIVLLVLALHVPQVHASHGRGGEIRYTYISVVPGGLQYEIQVDLYGDPAAPADFPELLLSIDGVVDTVQPWSVLPLLGQCPQTERWTFLRQHVFPGPGTYHISVENPNRTGETLNIPNSMDTPLGLAATLIIDVSGPTSSPHFNAPQTDVTYGWNWLLHDPQATDPDGDSLSFESVAPLGASLLPILGYMSPEAATPPGDLTWIDGNGVFLWDQPTLLGNFQIAIKCTEWRNGVAIGSVTRDMMLCIWQLPTSLDEPASTNDPWLIPDGTAWRYRIPTDMQGDPVTVIDAGGRVVMRPSTGSIDLSSLSEGVYAVTCRSATGRLRSARVAVLH